jgi:transcriptional regulator with XRE-family HTH domain
MVGTPSPTRKQRFKAALAYAGMTQKQFCEAAEVTKTHLHAVLNGERESPPLTAKVDAFIAQHTPSTVAA